MNFILKSFFNVNEINERDITTKKRIKIPKKDNPIFLIIYQIFSFKMFLRGFNFFLGAFSPGGLMVPSPKIFKNLP